MARKIVPNKVRLILPTVAALAAVACGAVLYSTGTTNVPIVVHVPKTGGTTVST